MTQLKRDIISFIDEKSLGFSSGEIIFWSCCCNQEN